MGLNGVGSTEMVYITKKGVCRFQVTHTHTHKRLLEPVSYEYLLIHGNVSQLKQTFPVKGWISRTELTRTGIGVLVLPPQGRFVFEV